MTDDERELLKRARYIESVAQSAPWVRCPIDVVSRLAATCERLEGENAELAKIAHNALGGPVKEFQLLLSCERQARQEICNLKAENARLREAVRAVKIRLHFEVNRPGSWAKEIELIEAALRTERGAE